MLRLPQSTVWMLASLLITELLFVAYASFLWFEYSTDAVTLRSEINGLNRSKELTRVMVQIADYRGACTAAAIAPARSNEFQQTCATASEVLAETLSRIPELPVSADAMFELQHGNPSPIERFQTPTGWNERMRKEMYNIYRSSKLELDPLQSTYSPARLAVLEIPDLIDIVGQIRGMAALIASDKMKPVNLTERLAHIDHVIERATFSVDAVSTETRVSHETLSGGSVKAFMDEVHEYVQTISTLPRAGVDDATTAADEARLYALFVEGSSYIRRLETAAAAMRNAALADLGDRLESIRVVSYSIIAGSLVFQCLILFLGYRVQQDYARLRKAQEAESRLLSNMSHEMRNPLNGMLGLLHNAIEESDPQLIKSQLQTALVAGEQLHKIVDDILDIKKMEAGEFKLVNEPFDYLSLGESLRRLIGGLAAQKNIDIQFELGSDRFPRFVIGDKVRITQIVHNLLGNAIKFTPENGCVITTQSYDYDTETVTFKVQDSGIGMTPETMSILFTRFKQADDGSTKQHQGTGLGLAITKRLLDLGGGTIEVESEPGEGSTFTVKAPLPVDWERENAWLEGKVAEVTPVTPAAAPVIRDVRVLCVDDSRINLKVASRPLIKAGAQVEAVLSGKEALALLESRDFDIVISDISMPEMDGEELQQHIRQIRPELPVVALTGNVLEDDVERYLANGFVAALAKPLDVDRLFEVIDQQVGKSAYVQSTTNRDTRSAIDVTTS